MCLSVLNTQGALGPWGVSPTPSLTSEASDGDRLNSVQPEDVSQVSSLPLLHFPLTVTLWHLRITEYLQQVLIKWTSDFIL
jgi:hypothetical protein